MDNLLKLTTKIKKFYELVEIHETKIQDLIQRAKKPLHSIINQSMILRAIIPEDSIQNTPFKKFKNFRESLTEIVLNSLEEEVIYLTEVRDEIEAINETLHSEQKSVEKLFNDLWSKNLIDISRLNPCSPFLQHIVDWCYDVWCYYHSFYLQISQALINLDFENEETLTIFSKSFKEDLGLKKHINKIRSFGFENFEFFV